MSKTLFVSDLHLGTKISKAKSFLEVINKEEWKEIYLIGDIIDMIALKQNHYLKHKQSKIITTILKKSKNTPIYYLVGNHDIFLEPLINTKLGKNLHILDTKIFETKNKKYLVLHGHQYDLVFMKKLNFLYHIGNKAYDLSLFLNRIYNKMRKIFKLEYFSLSLYLKTKVKNVISFINDFDELLEKEAKKMKCDGVIYGHTHYAKIEEKEDKFLIMNSGCFTEYCSYIVYDDITDTFTLMEHKL